MDLDEPVNANALRYAVECTKVFLMEKYKRQNPYIFGDAFLDVRSATPRDYFIPPSIADQCIVVTGTRFGELSCRKLSCFPFKEGWEACEEQDEPRWIRMGQHFELACQKSCQEHSINTDWMNGKCVAANPLKKVLASMPEKLFERASRHVFHGGLDVIDGTLKFNQRYCEAYGLDFVQGDCVVSGGQKFGEWLFGKTFIRGAKTASLSPLTSVAPPVPDYVKNYPEKRKKRALQLNEVEDDETVKQVIHELALDLAKDFGREVSDRVIEKFLRQKAPALFSRTMDKLATKLALKHSVATSLSKMGATGLSMFGKAFMILTNIYALYELAMAILDSLDPYDFMKVLDKNTLDKIDTELDYVYFKDEVKRPEITPEYIWDMFEEDESEKLEFMISKIEEYLNAVYAIPAKERKLVETSKFAWIKEKEQSGILFKGFVIILICFTLMFVQWIHFWTSILFFAMVWYNL